MECRKTLGIWSLKFFFFILSISYLWRLSLSSSLSLSSKSTRDESNSKSCEVGYLQAFEFTPHPKAWLLSSQRSCGKKSLWYVKNCCFCVPRTVVSPWCDVFSVPRRFHKTFCESCSLLDAFLVVQSRDGCNGLCNISIINYVNDRLRAVCLSLSLLTLFLSCSIGQVHW